MIRIQNTIVPGEKIIYQGKIHWLVFLPGIIWLSAALLIAIFFNGRGLVALSAFYLTACCAALALIEGLIIKVYTKVAITSMRVIVHSGLLHQVSIETSLANIDSFDIDQGAMGMLTDCGNIVMHLTGGRRIAIEWLASPMNFRELIIKTSPKAQR